MHEINFDYSDEIGATLFHSCIRSYVSRSTKDQTDLNLTMKDTIQRTIDNLFYLMEKGEQYTSDIQKIVSRPNHIGETVFHTMFYSLGDKAVIKFLINWNIDINIVKLNFDTCNLATHPEYNEILLKKKMNPKIIGESGKSPLDGLTRSSISLSPQLQKLVNIYPNAVYFSTVPQICDDGCTKLCKSRMEPFQIGLNGDGQYITANDKTRIGVGGFGTVFHGKWHGRESAFKYILIRDETSKNWKYVHEVYNHFNKNIIEYREQLDVSRNPNSGVIIPNAFYRQQLQYQDDHGQWIACNYNVFVYPRYDCNLHELHTNHFTKMDKKIKLNILDQCFTR